MPGTVLTAELSGVATGWVNVEVRYFDAAGEIAYLDYVWEESEPFPWGGVAYSNFTFDPSRGFMQYQPRHVWDTAREAAMAVFDPAPLDAQLLVSVPAKAAETMTANPNLVRYELGVHNTNAFGSYSLAMTFTDPAGCSQTDTIWPGRSID